MTINKKIVTVIEILIIIFILSILSGCKTTLEFATINAESSEFKQLQYKEKLYQYPKILDWSRKTNKSKK